MTNKELSNRIDALEIEIRDLKNQLALAWAAINNRSWPPPPPIWNPAPVPFVAPNPVPYRPFPWIDCETSGCVPNAGGWNYQVTHDGPHRINSTGAAPEGSGLLKDAFGG
jgi:hypothetical protein